MPSRHALELPLQRDFRFIDQPLEGEWLDARYVGSEPRVRAVADRIAHAHGGTVLVTGYRGVGKTSFVHRVLQRLDALDLEAHAGTRQVVVRLNVARPVTSVELLHHLIRQLYHRLDGDGLLGRIHARAREELVLAYRRTSLAIKFDRQSSSEVSVGVGGTLGRVLEQVGVKGLDLRRSRSLAVESSFLAYDERAAEQDFLRVVDLLRRTGHAGRRRLWDRLRRRPAPVLPLRVVVVIDELDKLEAQAAAGQSPVEDILRGLKNVLTAAGITFVLVAGRDLYDRWRREVARGDSVFENVVTHLVYLPCMWDGAEALCTTLLLSPALRSVGLAAATASEDDRATLADLLAAIDFHGRGLPRRMLREIARHIEFDGPQGFLRVPHEAMRVVRFHAHLRRILVEALPERAPNFEDGPAWLDRLWMGVSFVVDSLLRRGAVPFGADELGRVAEGLNETVRDVESLDAATRSRLLEVLVRNRFLERVAGEAVPDGERLYRLSEWARSVLRQEARPGAVVGERVELAGRTFELLDTIGRGGMATVHRVREVESRASFALKVLLPSAASRAHGRVSLEREAAALQAARHPAWVSCHGLGDHEGLPALLLELVEGVPLSRLIAGRSPLGAPVAAAVGHTVASGLAALHGAGYHRCDLTPGNVLVDMGGRVRLIDLGIVLGGPDGADVPEAILRAGTPGFAAPEQIMGRPVGPAADLYALGVLLLQICGPAAMSPEHPLHALIGRCMRPDPAGRMTDAGEAAAALAPHAAGAHALALLVLGALAQESADDDEGERDEVTDVLSAFPSERRRPAEPSVASPRAAGPPPWPAVVPEAAPTPRLPNVPVVAQAPRPLASQTFPPAGEGGSPPWPVPTPRSLASQTIPPAGEVSSPPRPVPTLPTARSAAFEAAPTPVPEPRRGLPVPIEATTIENLQAALARVGSPTRTLTGHKPMLALRFDAFGTRHFVPTRGARIGRVPPADIVIPSTTLSRIHAEIGLGPDGRPMVVDLASANATFVNDRRVMGATALVPGDVVRFGDVEATVESA